MSATNTSNDIGELPRRSSARVRMAGILAIAATCLIAAATAWRWTHPEGMQSSLNVSRSSAMPAPLFEGHDSNNQMFRLVRYVGRHSIILAFFDGQAGADLSDDLQELRREFGRIARGNVKIVAVTASLPQQNRRAMERDGRFPFPLVTDVDLSIHQKWGRWSDAENRPLTGVCWIDRRGFVEFRDGHPLVYSTARELLEKHVK